MATVIKSKFGDTLRRIYDEKYDFDMATLREHICILFNLKPDSDFTLTYIDEDGDVVTIYNDDDLVALASQSLNPIRMTVTHNHLPSTQSLNTAVSWILKFVPERQHNALLKLLLDAALENMMGASESDSKNESLQLEPVKKDEVLENVELNVGNSKSETAEFSLWN